MRLRLTVALAAAFLFGLAAGGFLFSRSLPRSFLAVAECGESCARPSDFAGLVASAAIQRTPVLIPGVVMETDDCLALRSPVPEARIHFVLFPKRDAKDIGALTAEDQRPVMGCFALVGQLARRFDAPNYWLTTNGPGRQKITYLHFHFLSE